MTCELKDVHTRQAKDEEFPNRVCVCVCVREREDVRERAEVEEVGSLRDGVCCV